MSQESNPTLESLTQELLAFRKEREWEKYHTPKDMAISLSLEAAEVLEHFQWKTAEDVQEYIKAHKDDIGEELADVFNWVILLSHDLGIDILSAAQKKIAKNHAKYPLTKIHGTYRKYTEI